MAGDERKEVFEALGAETAGEIRAVLEAMPETSALREYAATAHGRRAIDSVLDQTRARHELELNELRHLATGAGVEFEMLLLANLRGDLGGNDGVGCSELAYRGERSLLAHNEDGAPALNGQFMLLTLKIADEAAVTVQWYPGFLPSNTFVATGNGLVWGINHVQIPTPVAAAGRHFVARGLQRQPDLDSAVHYLANNPSAGGFAYTIGELQTGRIVTVEAAADQCASIEANVETQPQLWHTNHLRLLSLAAESGSPAVGAQGVSNLGMRDESEARGQVLAVQRSPTGVPSVSRLLDLFGESVMPDGVFRSAAGGDPLMTLCTSVVDLSAKTITLRLRGESEVTLDAIDYANGRMDIYSE